MKLRRPTLEEIESVLVALATVVGLIVFMVVLIVAAYSMLSALSGDDLARIGGGAAIVATAVSAIATVALAVYGARSTRAANASAAAANLQAKATADAAAATERAVEAANEQAKASTEQAMAARDAVAAAEASVTETRRQQLLGTAPFLRLELPVISVDRRGLFIRVHNDGPGPALLVSVTYEGLPIGGETYGLPLVAPIIPLVVPGAPFDVVVPAAPLFAVPGPSADRRATPTKGLAVERVRIRTRWVSRLGALSQHQYSWQPLEDERTPGAWQIEGYSVDPGPGNGVGISIGLVEHDPGDWPPAGFEARS